MVIVFGIQILLSTVEQSIQNLRYIWGLLTIAVNLPELHVTPLKKQKTNKIKTIPHRFLSQAVKIC